MIETIRNESDSFQKCFLNILSGFDENEWELLEKMANELAAKENL